MRQIDYGSHITRTRSDYLDSILGQAAPILDHGFIRVIDYMGDDHAIDEAARMSYGQGTKRTSEAQGLLNYLMAHGHTSPFEMCELKLHIKLPIFVMRQLVRQRMASLNEYSARYSVLKDEFYLPDLSELRRQSKTNKQGSEGQIDGNLSINVQQGMRNMSQDAYAFYLSLISDDVDLARELARINLPVNFYTEVYWKIDLHNLFKFLKQRTDSHAQKEIRVYADQIDEIVSQWVPMAYKAYVTYVRNAISFSGVEAPLIRLALSSGVSFSPEFKPTFADALTKREWVAFCEKIQRIK